MANLVVLDEYRRQGIASMLLDTVFKLGRAIHDYMFVGLRTVKDCAALYYVLTIFLFFVLKFQSMGLFCFSEI